MVYIISKRVYDAKLKKDNAKPKTYSYYYLCKSERNKDKVNLRNLAYLGKELPDARSLNSILKKKKIKASAKELLEKFNAGKRRKKP